MHARFCPAASSERGRAAGEPQTFVGALPWPGRGRTKTTSRKIGHVLGPVNRTCARGRSASIPRRRMGWTASISHEQADALSVGARSKRFRVESAVHPPLQTCTCSPRPFTDEGSERLASLTLPCKSSLGLSLSEFNAAIHPPLSPPYQSRSPQRRSGWHETRAKPRADTS